MRYVFYGKEGNTNLISMRRNQNSCLIVKMIACDVVETNYFRKKYISVIEFDEQRQCNDHLNRMCILRFVYTKYCYYFADASLQIKSSE